jgi:hypothetical protein
MTLAEIYSARDAVHAARVANSAERRRLLSVGASFPERQALVLKASELARQARELRHAHWAAIDAELETIRLTRAAFL